MSLLSPQLLGFMAVVDNNTVHAAAKALHLTQTAVTQRIRSLEAALKTTLFIRSRRGMLLTPEGEALLRYCLAARDLEKQTLAAIKGVVKEALVRVGITGPSSLMHARILPQCYPLVKKYKNMTLEFDVRDKEGREQLLRSGKYQFALLSPQHVTREMDYKMLRPEKYLLVCSHHWQGRKLAEIIKNERIIDFNPQDQMTFNYLKKYQLLEQAQHERHFINHPESIANLIMEGHGYSVLSDEFCRSYIKNKQLIVLNAGKIYENPITLAWYPRPEPSGYFADLIAEIK